MFKVLGSVGVINTVTVFKVLGSVGVINTVTVFKVLGICRGNKHGHSVRHTGDQ